GAEIEAKKLHLITDFAATPATVVGDVVRLQQVFWNILRNAAKFTPPEGLITVTTASVGQGKHVEVCITDTGMGMNAAEIGRLFNAFTQGDHAGETGSHQFGGLGLGLAISRMLVELHSGRISGTSKGPGQGSTFTVQLPVRAAAGSESVTGTNSFIRKPAITSNMRASRILLVEDHEPTRTALTQLLIRRHYVVVQASGVKQALATAEKEKFDLLITDIGLPDGDGYEVMRAMRQSQHLKGIALTGYGMQEDIEQSHMAGFDAHLTKPITIQALEAALASVATVAPVL
ncbi:MAG: ATP-binding protein, partial [Opitutaceae bacterium]